MTDDRTTSDPHAVAASTALLALFCSVVTSGAQSAVLGARHLALGELIGFPREFVWMTLLAYLPFFLVLWLACGALGRLVPRLRSVRAHVFVYALFGAMCVGVLFPVIATIARFVLSLGLAVVVSRSAASSFAHGRRSTLLWRGTTALVLLQVLGGLVVRNYAERARSGAAAAPAVSPAAAGAPNVLFIILDTVRALSLGAYGNQRPVTPSIDRFAREGVMFASAYATAPWTLPSHASAFTGMLPHGLDADYKVALERERPVVAEVFRDHGWATGAFIANMYYAGWETGIGRGFDTFVDYQMTLRQVLMHALVLQTEWARDMVIGYRRRSASAVVGGFLKFRWFNSERFPHFDRKWAGTVNQELLEWIPGVGRRPFFAFLNYFDAHIPYNPPPPFLQAFDSSGVRRPLDAYEGAMLYLDANVGELLAELERRKILDNTIVVVTSDHGEQFGEHGLWEHGNSVYAPTIQVPMIIRFPRSLQGGRVVAGAVSIADLPATLSELAGLGNAGFPGVSLVPLMSGRAASRGTPVVVEHVPGKRSPPDSSRDWRALVDDSLYYVAPPRRPAELYRVSDLRQVDNLATMAEYRDLLRAYRERLDSLSPSRIPAR